MKMKVLVGVLALATLIGSVNPTVANAASKEVEQVTITVPEGFGVDFGYQQSYQQTYLEETSHVTTDGKTTYVFSKQAAAQTNFYRVYSLEENKDAVTYWGWSGSSENTADFEVTEEMLTIGDDSKNADTTYRFENNIYDVADINITGTNDNGHISIEKVGDSIDLQAERDWQCIESFRNAQITEPDYNYQVVDFSGNKSNVVSITKDNGAGNDLTVTANEEGTAIILISYDAVTSSSAYGAVEGNNTFSACWGKNVGVVVVSVGANATVEEDGIDIDSEVDSIFYTGNEGASYTFTPVKADKLAVNVYKPITTANSLTFAGAADNSVTYNEDGTVTITGLAEGTNIIEQNIDGNITYQLIKAEKTDISYSYADAEGNEITENQVKAGCSVTASFSNLDPEVIKLAGIYNVGMNISYKDAEGKEYKGTSSIVGFATSYDYASNEKYHSVTITIPEDFEGDSYNLEGRLYIGQQWSQIPGYHKYMNKVTGYSNGKTGTGFRYCSYLPAISINIAKAAEPTPEVTPSPEPTPEVTPSPEPTPEVTPSPEPTPEVTPSPKPTPVVTSTATPVVTPAATPAATPTATPVVTPTATPAVEPTSAPSIKTSGDVSEISVSGVTIKNTKGKKVKLSWKKDSSFSGYALQITTNKKKPGKVKYVSAKKNTYTSAKLKKGKTYYVRIAGYVNSTENGKTKKVLCKYTAWKKITIKK